MLALLRTEIKTWERDFASTHGRDPSVQDIREHPPIAEKYKLYKKLSKLPSTPPQTHSRLPALNPRTAEPVPPLPGFNPFSPVKKSAKRNVLPPTSPHPNPFATPAKHNPKRAPRTMTPSPDPFPSILQSQPNAVASSSHVLPVSTTAVSRARKRLRGDPVSPSPNKPKRQRVRSHALPSTLSLDQDDSSSEQEADNQLPLCDLTSFVADSPVKAPAGGKSFKLLFDDALPSLHIPKKPIGVSVAMPDSPVSRSPHSLDSSAKLDSKRIPSPSRHLVDRPQPKIRPRVFPAKDHPSAPSHKAAFKTVVSEDSQPRTSSKRTLDAVNSQPEQTPTCPLVPPSPPPQASINRDTGKGKTKATASRKKLRVESAESDDELDTTNDITLKVATVSLDRSKHSNRHADDLDWDPLLHLGTRNHDPALEEQIDANRHAAGTFSVNLPDKFRRVLAISPSRSQDTEERVVHGLLYGVRIGHHDPARGGDIWDAGEMDECALGDVGIEDDWESEPVPWEVGEL